MIDNIYTNIINVCMEAGKIYSDISDHVLIYIVIINILNVIT